MFLQSIIRIHACDADTNNTELTRRNAFRIGIGFNYGKSKLMNESPDYNHEHVRFPTRSYFFTFETPHRHLYISLRGGLMSYNASLSGKVNTFGDVEGQGTPSYVISEGYDYDYSETTTDSWFSARLLYAFGLRDEYIHFSVGVGWGKQNTISHKVETNTKTSWRHRYGTTYGAPPDYPIIHFDNWTETTSVYLSDTHLDRKKYRRFIELCYNAHIQITKRTELTLEIASRLFKPYYHTTLQGLNILRYRYVGLNFTFSFGMANQK